MNNFFRTLRLVLRYKWTLCASTITAILVAVLWGANIGGAYPVIEIITRNQSMQTWINEGIASAKENVDKLKIQKQEIEANLAAADKKDDRDLQRSLANINSNLKTQQTLLESRQWWKPYIDQYLPNDPYQTLVVIMMVISLGYILKNFFLVCDSILVDRLANLATLDLRKKFYRRTLRMDLSSFGEARTSELMSRFTYDIDSLGHGIQAVLGRAVREPLKMAVCLGCAAWVCWRLLLVSALIAPIAGFLIGRLAKTLKRANRRAMEEMSGLYNILTETFGGIKVVKAFTMERHERLRFHRNSKQFFRKAMKISV